MVSLHDSLPYTSPAGAQSPMHRFAPPPGIRNGGSSMLMNGGGIPAMMGGNQVAVGTASPGPRPIGSPFLGGQGGNTGGSGVAGGNAAPGGASFYH